MADSEAEVSFRCWICLEDAETLDGMISPCACVGTNRWVHEDCIYASHPDQPLNSALRFLTSRVHPNMSVGSILSARRAGANAVRPGLLVVGGVRFIIFSRPSGV